MNLYSQLLIVVVAATCQANQYPLAYSRQLARQGVLYQPSDKSNELDPNTLLIPDDYKPGYLRTNLDQVRRYPAYHNSVRSRGVPNVYSRAAIHQLQEAKRQHQAALDEIDREALSKISDEDRELLLTKLSPRERQALLARLDELDLNEINYESRFGLTNVPSDGFAGAAAKIGAGAGGYIGGKLAGALGAKLGAAAGAYLGAAAATKLQSTVKGLVSFGGSSNSTSSTGSAGSISNIGSNDKPAVNYGYGSYGAVVVKHE